MSKLHTYRPHSKRLPRGSPVAGKGHPEREEQTVRHVVIDLQYYEWKKRKWEHAQLKGA
jgi:hypothetical protein